MPELEKGEAQQSKRSLKLNGMNLSELNLPCILQLCLSKEAGSHKHRQREGGWSSRREAQVGKDDEAITLRN